MADTKETRPSYQLRGINQKTSKYEFPIAEFLDIRNMDFDVPNAHQKRPGSTYAIPSNTGTSGPISSLFEFTKLTGESYIVAGSDTAMFYLTAAGFTTLSTGWNNGQPADMLTFVNKLWMANGQNWSSFDGNTVLSTGLPISTFEAIYSNGATLNYLFLAQPSTSTGGSYFLVNGATMIHGGSGASRVIRSIYLAYSYLRSDGYQGPADFQLTARNIIQNSPGNTNEFFSPSSGSGLFWAWPGGFTVPAGRGITGISIWFAEDTIYSLGPQENIPGVGLVATGALGWRSQLAGKDFGSFTLKPGADLSRFWLYTTIPTSGLFATNDGAASATYWAASFIPGSTWATFDGVALGAAAFSAMAFDYFATYVPKYIEVNQNIMFAAGFSSAPSDMWTSEVGLPETFLPTSGVQVRSNDGDRIFAIAKFNNQIIVMKETSFHKFIGNSSDTYQLIEVSSQYGCLSNKSVVQVKQSLFWLDRKGILEYNGASFDIISTPVEGIFRRMNISAAKEKAQAVHHLYRNQIWFGIPIDGSTTNNFTVVYDYSVGAWTFFDGYNPASYTYAKGSLTKPTAWRGDYSGLVHYMGESFYSDSGQGITCLSFSSFENVGGENQTTLWRRLFLDVQPATGTTGTINGQVFTNYNTSSVQGTFAIYQNQFQTRAEMGVQGKAIAAQISHSSASLPLLINGYAWANRGLRNV